MRLTKTQWEKFSKNLLIFTAPALAVFFYQLSQGAEPKVAVGVAVFALYALLFDYFKKVGERK